MTTSPPTGGEASIGQLVGEISAQTSRLVRDELRLAQAELAQKGRRAGVGAGLFGGAGAVVFYGLGCLVAAAVLGLAGPLHAWLAALVVGVALLVVAGIAALVGRRQIGAAIPLAPKEAVDGLRTDVKVLKEGTTS